MKKHIKYPKIKQFRNVVYDICNMSTYVGNDENGEPIFDDTIEKPILKFHGTVKLHGTNASICYNANDFWIQSRTNIINLEKDNKGFAFFVEKNRDVFLSMFNTIIEENDIDINEYTIALYGEWVGKGIQKSIGISKIDKSFFIFGVKISKPDDDEFNSYWIDHSRLRKDECEIYNIENFQTFEIEIDFNNPQLAQNKLVELTERVEKECPVSKEFGFENETGEGIVWVANYINSIHRFKVKGEKHSVTKVKKLAEVDVEKLKSIEEFVEYSVTENRFNQAIDNIFPDGMLDINKLGDLLRWITNDIIIEEIDTLKENHLEPKEIKKYISNKARKMFIKAYNNF